MNKELEALKCLDNIESALWDDDFHYQKYSKELDTIKQALLKAQEQEKENSVLKACIRDWEDDYEHLKNALHKEKEILKIIKEKYVNIDLLTEVDTLEEYNSKVSWSAFKLTQEEFDLLKEVVSK